MTVTARLAGIDGRRLSFDVRAHDGIDEVSRGTHERAVIDRARFDAKAQAKGLSR